MQQGERRRHRSANTTRALYYQLDACLQESDLEGLVLTDDNGVCLALAGNEYACREIAAHVPLIGRTQGGFEGVVYGPDTGWDVAMHRFPIEGTSLYLCAIGQSADRTVQLASSIGGVSRILHT